MISKHKRPADAGVGAGSGAGAGSGDNAHLRRARAGTRSRLMLPGACIEYTVSFLGTREELSTCKRVCQRWYATIHALKEHPLMHRHLPPEHLEAHMRQFPRTTHLSTVVDGVSADWHAMVHTLNSLDICASRPHGDSPVSLRRLSRWWRDAPSFHSLSIEMPILTVEDGVRFPSTLRRLRLSYHNTVPHGLYDALVCLTQLRHLDLSDAWQTTAELAKTVVKLPVLRMLQLNHTEPFLVDTVSRMTQLRMLSMSVRSYAEIAALCSGLSHLRVLWLRLVDAATMVTITSKMEDSWIPCAGLHELSLRTGLQRSPFRHMHDTVNLCPLLRRFPRLRCLAVDDLLADVISVDGLHEFTTLTQLEVTSIGTRARIDVSPLERLPALTVLSLASFDHGGAIPTVTGLSRLTNLTRLNLTGVCRGLGESSLLTALVNLREVDISHTMFRSGDTTMFRILCKLPLLRRIRLDGCFWANQQACAAIRDSGRRNITLAVWQYGNRGAEEQLVCQNLRKVAIALDNAFEVSCELSMRLVRGPSTHEARDGEFVHPELLND